MSEHDGVMNHPLCPVGSGPDYAPPAAVQTAVASLVSVGASVQYPPINWSAVLSPLMRLGFGECSALTGCQKANWRPKLRRVFSPAGEGVQHQCLVLAAAQAQTSQSASLFLGQWLSAPLVHSLSVSSDVTSERLHTH